MKLKTHICTLNIGGLAMPGTGDLIRPARQRLAQAFSRLCDIWLVRDQTQSPNFGKITEERIIWRELLELELQEVDEQIERICTAAGER